MKSFKKDEYCHKNLCDRCSCKTCLDWCKEIKAAHKAVCLKDELTAVDGLNNLLGKRLGETMENYVSR